jgi:uncharacterized protein (TIGR02118 family)
VIFRSGVFSRKRGMSEQAFNDHWLRVHGELARHMPGVHRYLQNHVQERLYAINPDPDHPVDAISQQWFDDIAAMERCERSDEYAAVKRDIPNFQGAITILVLQDTPVIDAPAPDGAKLLVLSRLRAGAARVADALPELRRAAGVAPAPLRYVQNSVVDKAHPVSARVPSGQVPLDAMAELWFRDATALRGWVRSEAGTAFIHGQALLEPLYVLAVNELRIV